MFGCVEDGRLPLDQGEDCLVAKTPIRQVHVVRWQARHFASHPEVFTNEIVS